MRGAALLLAVMGMLLIGVVPAGAVDPVYEVEFNTQTGTTSSWTLVGTATGNSVSAEGEIVYTWTDGTTTRSMKLHDLKCLVVEPSTNLSYDTDFNVMVIGRMQVLLDPTGYWNPSNTWGYMAYAPDEERFSGDRPMGARDHLGEPPCDPWDYNNWSEVGYYGKTWTGNGYLHSGYVTVTEIVDSDGDGVLDPDDMCPGTILDDAPEKLKKNRFAADGAGLFVDKNVTESGFSVIDTYGCGEDQIIDMMGLGKAHELFGITRSAITTFIATYED